MKTIYIIIIIDYLMKFECFHCHEIKDQIKFSKYKDQIKDLIDGKPKWCRKCCTYIKKRAYDKALKKCMDNQKREASEVVDTKRLKKARNAWSKKKAKMTFASAKRRTAELNATPTWVNESKIKEIYRECADISTRTGIQHHVDHIIPLRGKKVCGLHVPWNLQVITASDNLKKSNHLIL